MKRSNWVRLLAVILVISLMVGPVSAVTFRSGEGNRQNALVGSLIGRIRDIVRDIIDDWFDQPFPGKPISPKPTTPVDPSEPVDNTDPTGPVDSTDPTDPEDPESTNSGLELVEGYSNTENGQLLRGHTYKLSEVISQQKPQNPISHIGLRKPISILPGNPIGGLRINAVTTTATEDEITVPDGLVAYYDFESVSGTTVSNVVTTNTTTTAELKDDASIVDTEFMGKAMKLNGGALQLSDVINATESSFSVSMWYKFDANHATSNNNINMIQAGTIGGNTGRTILIMRSNSKFYSYLCGADTADTNTSVIRSQWQHITFSYDKDAGKVYFYINGTADNADGISISGAGAHDTADMIIGRHRTDAAGRIYGFVDEVRVYNKALTAAEAAAIYKHNNENYEFTNWVDGGQYYIQNARAHFNNANSWLRAENNEIVGTDKANATLFTLDILDNGKYTLSYDDNGTTKYLYLNTNNGNATADEVSTSVQELALAHVYTGNVHGVVDDGHFIRIGSNGKYLCQYGGVDKVDYGAEANNATDSGVAMWFHLVKDGTESKVEHIAADDSRDIPLSVLSATAGSAHSGEGPENTLDTDTSSIWHTEYNVSDRNNHWITIALSDDYKVDGLRYLPRQNGSNGIITGYKIEVSTDGQNFRTVDTGTWADNADWKFAEFDAEHVRYVRLSATNAHGNFASAASIRLTGVSYEPPTTTLLYVPVTMFNYDMDTMNEKTISMYEEGSTLMSGIHFSDGTPAPTESVTYAVTAHTGEYTNGQYVIQNYRMKDISQPSWLTYSLDGEKGITSTANQADATIWTLTRRPGANVFTLTTEIDGTTYYMTMGNETSGVTTEYSEITLVYYTHTNAGIQITKDGYYLGHSVDNLFCGNTNSTSKSNGMGFFPVAENGTIGDTARNVYTINGAVTSGFSRWNWWGYLEGKPAQNKFFAELVQHELDENDDIVFNVIEPGIFKTGTGENIADKDVYTNVGLPFVLDEKTGNYVFNSDKNGVYFSDKDGDGDADPTSGTETELEKLVFEPGAPQGWKDMYKEFGDNSPQLWAPFNTNTNDTSRDQIDYHFGMRADIPFSMTPNGRIKSTDDKSAPITFTFSGDDDVWVFIDDHLVIDLGGIHNRIGTTIDFANNTITYFLPESNKSTAELGCYNDRTRYPLNADGKTITVKLYNDAEGEGSLGQTRVDFASQEEHTMSIFYMERGKGTSNCHIEFNLPMRDTVMVTKDITKSWSQAQADDDDEGDGTAPLTAKEQAAVNKLDFYFKLWKKEANGEMTVVANTNYFLQEKATGKVLGTFTTGADGKFALKNGQTAKFMTDISNKGVTYYVEELELDLTTFLTPDYNYAGLATQGFDYTGVALDPDSDEENATKEVSDHVTDASQIPEHELPMNAEVLKSYDVTAYGSIESIDSLEFICTNYLNAELPNPTARAYEDIIVIDYGLPVQIDPLANDLYRGDGIEIVSWGDKNLDLYHYLNAQSTANVSNGTSYPTSVDMADCLYTFTAIDGGYYEVSATAADGSKVYLNHFSSGNNNPNVSTAGKIKVETSSHANMFKLIAMNIDGSNLADRSLHFYSDASMPYWDRCGNDTTTKCAEFLYRPIREGDESSTEIPGYVMVTNLSEVVNGGQYLIAHKDDNGALYVLHPSTSTGKWDHVAKVQVNENAAFDASFNFHSGIVTFKDKTYEEVLKETVTNEGGTTTNIYEYTRDTFEYKLTKQLTNVEEIHYIIKVTSNATNTSRYALGKVYIVPATIMYYEENFADMITFVGSGWSDASDPQNISNAANISPFQEPGVVGTVNDSTYGSDVAYLSDDGDSNGTYRFGNTAQKPGTNGEMIGGAIRFSYTFTGTGTTIFARTSANTGYMQVKVYAIDDEGNETLQSLTYRDTYWKDQNKNDLDSTGTLYNIPVFSEEYQHYGTYKVVCTVAKAGTPTSNYVYDDKGNLVTDEDGKPVIRGAGNEFYLDGIRVMQPLEGVFAIDKESGKDYEIPVDQMDPLTAKGVGAYKTDGESNLEVATLRQKLITDAQAGGTDWSNENFAVLTDTNGNIVTASEYISIGPKEEVYLSESNGNTNAQTVSFSLETWKPEGLKLYMGMKAPFGHAIVNVGDHAIELENAPDCYYDVTNFGSVTEMKDEDGNISHIITFTFEAAESIVSLTNIKIVGSYQIHLPEDTDINVIGFEGGN